MFWSAESGSGIADMVSGGSAPKLDARLADLKANGGKGRIQLFFTNDNLFYSEMV
jgi:hypothetical protein